MAVEAMSQFLQIQVIYTVTIVVVVLTLTAPGRRGQSVAEKGHRGVQMLPLKAPIVVARVPVALYRRRRSIILLLLLLVLVGQLEQLAGRHCHLRGEEGQAHVLRVVVVTRGPIQGVRQRRVHRRTVRTPTAVAVSVVSHCGQTTSLLVTSRRWRGGRSAFTCGGRRTKGRT